MSEHTSRMQPSHEPIRLTHRGEIVVRSGLAFAALAGAATLYIGYQYRHPEIHCSSTTQMSLEPTQGEDSIVATMVSYNPKLNGLDLYQLRATVEDANPTLKDPSHIPQAGETFDVPTGCDTHVDLF